MSTVSDATTLLQDLCPGGQLDKEEGGRPYLLKDGVRLACGITHTRGLTVVAVCGSADIGIDCERLDRVVDGRLSARMSHPGDDPALSSDPLTAWILKESVLKCVGQGLRAGMSTVRLGRADQPHTFSATWNSVEFDVLFIDQPPHRIGIAIRTPPP